MRYSVGQKVWTIGLSLIEKDTGNPVYPIGFLAPHPGQLGISKLYFNALTVSEHHKVSGEWSDELEYDGFILKDEKDRVWHNQYPVARYGQISDSGDGLFESTLFEQMLIEHESKGLDPDWDSACAEFMQINQMPINQYSLTRFMNDLAGGLLDENGTTRNQRSEIWPKLVEIRDRVVKEFNETTGKVLESYIDIKLLRWRVAE